MNKSLLDYWLTNNSNFLVWIPIIAYPFVVVLFIYFIIKEKNKKEKIRPILGLITASLFISIFMIVFVRTPSSYEKTVIKDRFKGVVANTYIESIELFPPFDEDESVIGDKEKIIIDKQLIQRIEKALNSIDYYTVKAPITYNEFRMIFVYDDGKQYEFRCSFTRDAGTILSGRYGSFQCNALEKTLIDSGIINYTKGWYPFSNEAKKTAIYKKVVLKRRKQP